VGSSKYLLMDSSIISKGMIFDFNIFIPSNANKEIKLFKDKNYTTHVQRIIDNQKIKSV